MAGQQGVLELGQHGVLVAEDLGEQGLAGADAGDGVAADLLLDRHGHPARFPELAEVRRAQGHDGQPIPDPAHAAGTPEVRLRPASRRP